MKAGTFLAAALIFLSLFPLHAERGMKKEKAHVICKDGHRMKILIYSPDSPAEEPSTGVLWIHGGGYITGMASMAGMMGRPPALLYSYFSSPISFQS